MRIVFILFVLLMFLSACSSEEIIIEEDISEQDLCDLSGGEWVEFSNTCGDSCSLLESDDIECGDAITDACDCGDDMCWNGQACQTNP
tara:strand:- start:186 stop:449 length:264 start_codon:yes stop_codon:yes gene_type:complete